MESVTGGLTANSMIRVLMHEKLLVRTAGSVSITFVFLTLVWVLSAAVLQPGIIRGNLGAWLINIPVASSAAFLFVLNLVFGAGGITLLNHWHDARGLAAGYYIHIFRSALFHGLLRGTNSFTFPYSSQAEVVQGFFRVGLWETLALSLICAATASLAGYPVSSFEGLPGFLKFLRNPAEHLGKKELSLFLAGITLLALAAVQEAFNIFKG